MYRIAAQSVDINGLSREAITGRATD